MLSPRHRGLEVTSWDLRHLETGIEAGNEVTRSSFPQRSGRKILTVGVGVGVREGLGARVGGGLGINRLGSCGERK